MTQDASDTPNDTSPLFSDNTVTEETPSIEQQDGSNPPQDDEITKLKGEIGQLREQLARSQADYNNLVRRSREESSQIGEWSENKTILKFLPILDNLERALEHTPEEFKGHAWTEGFISIIRSMQKVLTDFGVSHMNCVGEEVNPDFHDVISQTPHASMNIQAEVEAGYLRGDKALRHAKVIVGDGTQT